MIKQIEGMIIALTVTTWSYRLSSSVNSFTGTISHPEVVVETKMIA